MGLLEDAFKPFCIINKIIVDDGYGGVKVTWVDGATIQGAIRIDSSPEMKIAQALNATNLYTLTVRKDIDLDYHVVLRRKSDDKIFRITTNSDDNKTPPTAMLNMKQYQAEEWRLTNE